MDSPKPTDLSVIELISNCTCKPAQQTAHGTDLAVVSLLPTVIIAPKMSMNGMENSGSTGKSEGRSIP